jgi:hypothetical protein
MEALGRRACFPSIIRVTIIVFKKQKRAELGFEPRTSYTQKNSPTVIHFQIYEVYTLRSEVLPKSLRSAHIRHSVSVNGAEEYVSTLQPKIT